MPDTQILPVFYLPPVNYLSTLLTSGRYGLFEQHEHFPKQTFRNRATVLSPNGQLDLIVPVIKGSRLSLNGHTKMKDVQVSNEYNWQRLHWKSLESCYRSSAYFEYYEDELLKFYQKKYTFLLDLNLELFSWLLAKMKQKIELKLTEEYQEKGDDFIDLRSEFNKKEQQNSSAKPYFQVFDDRNGFIPNLSSVDLLFNQGPQAINYL